MPQHAAAPVAVQVNSMVVPARWIRGSLHTPCEGGRRGGDMRGRVVSRQSGCAAFWVRGIAAALESEGLDPGRLFAELGLDPGALDDPDARFASEKVDQVWQVAVPSSGNPAFGLASARTAKPASFDVVAYA